MLALTPAMEMFACAMFKHQCIDSFSDTCMYSALHWLVHGLSNLLRLFGAVKMLYSTLVHIYMVCDCYTFMTMLRVLHLSACLSEGFACETM